VLGQSPGITEPEELIAGWEEHNRGPFERAQQVLADVRAADNPDLAMLSVSLRELGNLV
jgi:NAD-specific glutamate dehydrogenase